MFLKISSKFESIPLHKKTLSKLKLNILPIIIINVLVYSKHICLCRWKRMLTTAEILTTRLNHGVTFKERPDL